MRNMLQEDVKISPTSNFLTTMSSILWGSIIQLQQSDKIDYFNLKSTHVQSWFWDTPETRASSNHTHALE